MALSHIYEQSNKYLLKRSLDILTAAMVMVWNAVPMWDSA